MSSKVTNGITTGNNVKITHTLLLLQYQIIDLTIPSD